MPHMTETRNIGEPQTLPITDLNLHHKNARIGDVDTIKGSMVANGVYKPIVVNRGTYTGRPNEVLAGNHSLKAMRQLAEENPTDPRWQNIAVWLVDVDDERATRILLADNATADKGTYDQGALLELLESVDHDLDGTGYTYDELDTIRQTVEDMAGDVDWDSAFDNMPEDEPQRIQRTFYMTKEQADLVDSAVEYAKNEQGDVEGNANGAAIAWVCGQVVG